MSRYLEHYRMTFEMKCEGLTPVQLSARSVPPSTLSLLGLVRHLAKIEHHWFRRTLGRQVDLPVLYWTEAEPDLDFKDAQPTDECVADAWASWHRSIGGGHSTLVVVDRPRPRRRMPGEPVRCVRPQCSCAVSATGLGFRGAP